MNRLVYLSPLFSHAPCTRIRHTKVGMDQVMQQANLTLIEDIRELHKTPNLTVEGQYFWFFQVWIFPSLLLLHHLVYSGWVFCLSCVYTWVPLFFSSCKGAFFRPPPIAILVGALVANYSTASLLPTFKFWTVWSTSRHYSHMHHAHAYATQKYPYISSCTKPI